MLDKRLVKVQWHDAHATSFTAYAEHEIPHAALIVETVGWLLREDDSGVSVANEWCADGSYRGYTFVPKGMVLAVEDIVKPRPARKRKIPAESPIA